LTRRITNIILTAAIILLGLTLEQAILPAQAQPVVVRAVLFFSPSCSHCQKVILEVLPPLRLKYGDQLDILEVNVATVEAQELYRAAVERYEVPEERHVVPLLFVGDRFLVGSREIPEKLPGIIEEGIVAGGIPWPDLPGLSDAIASRTVPTSETIYTDTKSISPGSGLMDKFNRDPIGNFLAILTLLGLAASAIFSYMQVIHLHKFEQRFWPEWIPFTLIVIGLGIALYLSYIEITHSQAVCGPIGDCNTVQQSPYAILFGVIPVGLLGVVGYLMIGLAQIIQKAGVGKWKYYSASTAWALTLIGALFFIYLTFLEPFVIGATCSWCLISAVVMILLLWASTPQAMEAWKAIKSK
jgi:uncharacterized membrane protein